MKKTIKVLLLIVFALSMITIYYAQTTQTYTREELLQLIAEEKQAIKEAAKELIVDTLPELMENDPDAADQALARASGMLNTMDPNDLLYLLGHMYARIGENTRAITTFNSILKTHLNDDARKMLNLVLYQQMISYLQKNNRTTAKDFLRAIVFENFNIDRYYPTYLYIWADMSAEDGEFETVNTMLENYNQNRDTILNKILPDKRRVIARVNTLNFDGFFRTSTQDEYQKLYDQIESIKIDLTKVYNELISLKGIIYLDSIVRLHKEEMEMLTGLQTNIDDYLNSSKNTDAIITEGYKRLMAVKQYSIISQKQLDILDLILQKQYERFVTNDPTIIDSNYSDLEMKRLVEIEKNIELYNEIVSELDIYIADPDLYDRSGQLMGMRSDFSEKLSDMQIRKDKYLETRKHLDDVEEQIFNGILMEYYAIKEDKKAFDVQIAEIDSFFKNEARQLFDVQLRHDIKSNIGTRVEFVANSGNRDEAIRLNAQEILSNIDFIKLQLAYRNLRAKDQARLAKSGTISEELMISQKAEIIAEKQDLINKITAFIAANPDYKAIEQPDSTYLVTNADLYFNLAELQYDVNIQNPEIAMASYRKVVDIGPNFHYRDAALYNIGFISSQLKMIQIDVNRSRFYDLNQAALALDDASRYKYSDFAEAMDSYQSIVDNHKDSEYYDESLYRLGVLNYFLATDAEQPARYYALAINQFNELIEKPNSKFKYDAIYQRGWLRLNSLEEQDLKLAMSDFLTLLTAIENQQITDPKLVRDYREDAVNNIAYCLIAMDGLDYNNMAKGVAELQSMFANFSNKDVIRNVVDQAAKKKFNLDASMQAVDFMWLKINLAPLALENPTFLDSILMVYERDSRNLREGQDISLARQDIYLNLINNYSKDSEWYKANKDNNIAPQMVVIRKAYEERSKRLKNDFLQDSSNEAKYATYLQHMDAYAGYAELFDGDLATWKQTSEKEKLILSTMLAESSKQPKDYYQAITNIQAYNSKYPEDEDYFQHEGLSYTFSTNMFSSLRERFLEPGFTVTPGLPVNEDSLFTYLSANSQRFIDVLRSEKYRNPEREQQAIGILLTLGDTQYDRIKYPEATTLYLKALEQEANIPDRTKFDIYGKLALMAQESKQYTKAEQYYRSALPFAQTPAESTAITNNINLQIQESFIAAETASDGRTPDYALAASERLRLASQLPSTDASKIQGLKWAAHQAFVNAKEYQKAIDLVLELAGTRSDMEEIWAYYYRASEIAGADSLMKNKELAISIRNDFIARYPSSNRAYNIRLAMIDEMQKDPTKKIEAAESLLTLHEEARSRAIDIGTDSSDALMINAGVLYYTAYQDNKDTNKESAATYKEKEIQIYKQFISTYPQHKNVIPYMEAIADDYSAKGDSVRFEQLAKEIFTKDKTKSARYKHIADQKLYRIWYAFDNAFKNKDYTGAFKQRDEYRKVETEYTREGLTFDSAKTYEYFAAVQKEYDDIQKRLAFLRTYDSQLATIERGDVLNASPAKLISVNINTRWETNLIGGSTRRIPNFKTSINSEVGKVNKLLKDADTAGFDVDNSRRLRAYNVIARIYERGAEVIKTQVGVYFRTSAEASGYRQQYQGDALVALIDQVAYSQNSDLLGIAAGNHINIYNRYVKAGYKDSYTERSISKLTEWNLLPDYKTDDYTLNPGWTQKIGDEPGRLTPESTTSPLGTKLGSVSIPASSDLTLTRVISAKVKPKFALLHIVYPYEVNVKMNGAVLEVGAVPTDTLITGKPITTRYAYYIPDTAWGEGQNIVELKVPNTTPEPQTFNMSLQVFSDRKDISSSIPNETVMIYSNTSWKVVQTDAETGDENHSPAILATNFGITPEQIDGLVNTAAKPIWFAEEALVGTAVFEVDFNLDTEFREGGIEFLAPESASIYLNGNELKANVIFDYDESPFKAFSSQAQINKSFVQQGKNTLRFVVKNSSNYRGLMAAISIVKAGKEEMR